MSLKRTSRHLITVIAGLLLLVGTAIAGSYPEKPITLIIPLGAGGSHDVNARVFTSIIPTYLGQPLIVKLMPGAGGQTGTAAAVKAKPDGYTLIFTHNFIDQLQPLLEDLPYDTNESLVPVARLNSAPGMIFVNSDRPWKTVEEMLDYGRKNPGKLKFATSGNWGATMTMGALVMIDQEVDVNYIPYKGGGPAIQAVLAGDADFSVNFPGPLLPLQESGKIRILSFSGTERHKDLPDVPTTEELGIPGSYMERIILAPRAVPEDRLKTLRDAFTKLYGDKTFNKMMARIGETTDGMSGPDYDKLRLQQKEDYQELVKKLSN